MTPISREDRPGYVKVFRDSGINYFSIFFIPTATDTCDSAAAAAQKAQDYSQKTESGSWTYYLLKQKKTSVEKEISIGSKAKRRQMK